MKEEKRMDRDMEDMRFLIVIKDVLYEWVEYPGEVCSPNCDAFSSCTTKNTQNNICKSLRIHVGSSITHRFKELK